MASTELQREALLMLRPVPTVLMSVETQTKEEIATQTEVQQALQEMTESCKRMSNASLEPRFLTYASKSAQSGRVLV